ncbi:MAG: hypothetical protein KKE77_01090 [Alphaproteobacteria bacterium]|nr:hypothetical protein [Alphaproteobacteria bacterium]
MPDTSALAVALERLEPVLVPERMPPEELDIELEVADILQGEEFERRLEAAKQGCNIGTDGEMVADPPGGKQRADSRSRPKLP